MPLAPSLTTAGMLRHSSISWWLEECWVSTCLWPCQCKKILLQTGDLQNGAWTWAGRYEQIRIAVFFYFFLNPLYCNIAIFKNKRNAFIAEVKLSKIYYTLQLVLSYKYTCRFKIIHVTCIVQLQIFQQNVYFSQLLRSYFIKLHRFRTRRRTF